MRTSQKAFPSGEGTSGMRSRPEGKEADEREYRLFRLAFGDPPSPKGKAFLRKGFWEIFPLRRLFAVRTASLFDMPPLIRSVRLSYRFRTCTKPYPLRGKRRMSANTASSVSPSAIHLPQRGDLPFGKAFLREGFLTQQKSPLPAGKGVGGWVFGSPKYQSEAVNA